MITLWPALIAVSCIGLSRVVSAAPARQPPDFRPEDHLNPARAHVRLALVDERGAPQAPSIRFSLSPDLRRPSTVRLTREGFVAGGRAVCAWDEGAFTLGSAYRSGVLVSAIDRGRACPAGVPVKSFAELPSVLFIEITRVNGAVAETRFAGVRYYFNLRSISRRAWDEGWLVQWPRASAPLMGGVDVPPAFRPRNRKAGYSIALRSSPSDRAARLATLSSLRQFEQFSIGDGALVAAVYGRANGWSRLRLLDGRMGWLAPNDSGKFVSLERLVSGQATSLSGDWDWTVAPAPVSAVRASIPHDPRRQWIGYLEPGEQAAATVPVFATPDRTQAPVAQYEREGDRTLAEVDATPDTRRPIVFSRRPGWLEVGLDGSSESYRPEELKRAWIEDTASRWTVHPVSGAQAERLLTGVWGIEAAPAVTVTETRRVAGELWLRITVFVGEACELEMLNRPGVVLGEGWVRAHDRFGRSVVWFETYCD